MVPLPRRFLLQLIGYRTTGKDSGNSLKTSSVLPKEKLRTHTYVKGWRWEAGPWRSRPPLDELVARNAVLLQKPMDTARDLARVRLQGKMPRIEHVCLDIFQIAAVRMSTLSREDKIILPPDN